MLEMVETETHLQDDARIWRHDFGAKEQIDSGCRRDGQARGVGSDNVRGTVAFGHEKGQWVVGLDRLGFVVQDAFPDLVRRLIAEELGLKLRGVLDKIWIA